MIKVAHRVIMAEVWFLLRNGLAKWSIAFGEVSGGSDTDVACNQQTTECRNPENQKLHKSTPQRILLLWCPKQIIEEKKRVEPFPIEDSDMDNKRRPPVLEKSSARIRPQRSWLSRLQWKDLIACHMRTPRGLVICNSPIGPSRKWQGCGNFTHTDCTNLER